MSRFRQIFFALVVMLMNCSTVWSASLVVTNSGNGTYAILGGGLNQVHGMELTLAYDSTALGSPVISWGNLGSGAVKAANTGVPGSISISVVSITPFPDSGQVAQISFNTSNGNGGITFIMAKLINASGTNIPVSAAIAASQQNTSTLTDASGNITPLTSADSRLQSGSTPLASTPAVLGAVSMPADSQPKSEVKPAEPPVNIPLPEPSAVPDDTASLQREDIEKNPVTPEKVVKRKQINYGSVLERFKIYQGARTTAALMALFEKPVTPELRQEPAIAVSDGSTGVRIYANFPKSTGLSPNINLSGVELVSLKYDEKSGALLLDLLPKKNRTRATVTILTDQAITTFPLTVVPPDVAITAQEAAFVAFLKDTGTKKPKFDLNSDGVHDYLDDYIYTGLFLIKKTAGEYMGKK